MICTTNMPYYTYIFKYISKSDAWDISFSTIGSKNGDEVINSGEMYSVMATIVKIIKDFISKKNPKKLQYSPAKNFDTDLRRAKLYDAYLKKNLNGWDVSKSGDYVVLTNPNVKTINKKDQSAKFKKLENKLVEKYMYSKFSNILHKKWKNGY